MSDQQRTNYQRIERAIAYISDHFKDQPSLEEVAAAIHVSPFHFQRMFTEWAGVSPKKYLQYLSIEYAKSILQSRHATMLDTAYETGLSGTSRLHNLFVKIEGMTPSEYKSGGAGLRINYCFFESPFGRLIVASTDKGICYMLFTDDESRALMELQERFPKAVYHHVADELQKKALCIFEKDWQQLDSIKLHLAGTPFQLKVWECLLSIPMGSLSTYGDIATGIGHPGAAQAVGGAVGSNPVAFLIPCHRVIRSDGKMGGYRWGTHRKSAMIGWEAAKTGM